MIEGAPGLSLTQSLQRSCGEEKSFIRELKPLFNVNARPTGPPTLMPSYWALRTRADEQEETITDLRDQLAVLQEMRGADDD
jgi:hypothetical protein